MKKFEDLKPGDKFTTRLKVIDMSECIPTINLEGEVEFFSKKELQNLGYVAKDQEIPPKHAPVWVRNLEINDWVLRESNGSLDECGHLECFSNDSNFQIFSWLCWTTKNPHIES